MEKMAENKKYVELIWHQKYDKIELGEKIPIEKPNLPFQTVETVSKPRIKGACLQRHLERWNCLLFKIYV